MSSRYRWWPVAFALFPVGGLALFLSAQLASSIRWPTVLPSPLFFPAMLSFVVTILLSLGGIISISLSVFLIIPRGADTDLKVGAMALTSGLAMLASGLLLFRTSSFGPLWSGYFALGLIFIASAISRLKRWSD
ncbi:hypothetical protein [Tardisphaera saccharovorans]